MDHLSDLSQAPVATGELTLGREGPGNQENNARTEPLATGTEQVLCSGLKNRMTSTDQAAEITQQSLEIGLDGL
jgi:hypothetical protein